LWFDHFRQENYEAAYEEAERVFIPTLFWVPLSEAATLGQLGRMDEARAAAKSLLRLRPDFEDRACELIGRYIKFDEVAGRIVEGLRKAGLDIGS
jgi:hypothetical protein